MRFYILAARIYVLLGQYGAAALLAEYWKRGCPAASLARSRAQKVRSGRSCLRIGHGQTKDAETREARVLSPFLLCLPGACAVDAGRAEAGVRDKI